MARQARNTSQSGVFHVMMRGINRQNIFEDKEDYYQFINILDRMKTRYDDAGNICGTNCTYYAYCLMSNHFHLLIKEGGEPIAKTMQRIAASYVYYYNNKYARDGHLFRDRYRSEPVNDMAYFITLLRYIHQNPVKAGMVKNVANYEFSSYKEYSGEIDPEYMICNPNIVLKRLPFEQLNDFFNDMLPDDVSCIETETTERVGLSDNRVWTIIREKTGVSNTSAFQQLDDEAKKDTLRYLKKKGASLRQLQRLTGISKSLIHRL